MFKFFTVCLYASAIFIFLLLDYASGNNVVCWTKELCCRVVCFVVRTIKSEGDLNLPVLLSEATFLVVIMAILRVLKRTQAKDKIDDLLARSRAALKQTDELMEKWRLRKLNYQSSNDYNSYLDEEPQNLQPYKLEVPILHMAIVDAIGERNKFERGDAADTICISDTTILSMTSLFDDDLSLLSDEKVSNFDEKETNFDERRLWNVTEEDNFEPF